MSSIASAVYIDTVNILSLNTFIEFIKKNEPDININEDEIKEVYVNVVNNRLYTSGGNMYQRIIISLFKDYIVSLNGFVYSEVDVGGWEPVICLLSNDPIEKPIPHV